MKWARETGNYAGFLAVGIILTVAFEVTVWESFGWLSALFAFGVVIPWVEAMVVAGILWFGPSLEPIRVDAVTADRWLDAWKSLRAEITTAMQSLYQIGAISGAIVVGLIAAYGVAAGANRLGAVQGAIQRVELLGYVLLAALALIFLGQAKQLAALHVTCKKLETQTQIFGGGIGVWHGRVDLLSGSLGFLELAVGASILATFSAVGLLYLSSGIFPEPPCIRYVYFGLGAGGFIALGLAGLSSIRTVQKRVAS